MYRTAPVSQSNQAILEERLDMFEVAIAKKQRDLAELMKDGKEKVRKMSNKAQKKQYLNRIKSLQKKIAVQEGMKANVDKALDTMKDVEILKPIMDIIRITKDESKKQLSQIDIDTVDDCVAELDVIVQESEDVTRVLAQPLSNRDVVYEEDIDDELDALFGDEEEKERESVTSPSPISSAVHTMPEPDTTTANQRLEKLEYRCMRNKKK